MTSDRENRIRERAYALWTSEGQPEGRQDEFWHRACDEIDREEGQQAPQGSAPDGASHQNPEADSAGALGTLQAEEAGLIGGDPARQARPHGTRAPSSDAPASQHGAAPDAAGALGTLQAEEAGLIGNVRPLRTPR